MATRNICTYPLLPNIGVRTNAIVEQEGKLQRVNLDHEFEKRAKSIFCGAAGESIFLKGAAEARVKNIILCGKSKQESTNGHQLFNAGYCEGVGSNASITVSDDEYTITATGGVSAGYGFSKFQLDSSKCVGKTLFMKVDSFTGGTGSGVMLYGFKGGANAVSYTLKPGDKFIECPIAEDIEEVKVYVYTNTTGNVFTEVNTVTVKGLMVTYDKNAEWEKYTGGAPSPRPDWEQEIVGLENPNIAVYRKNLFKPKAKTETLNGITITIDEDGIVTVNGTATKAAFFVIGPDLALKPSENYVLSGCDGGGFDSYMLYLHYKESGLDVYNRTGETTFTARDEAFSPVVVVYEGVTVNNLVLRPMIRPAAFEKNDFESYTEQFFTVPCTLHGIPVTTGGNYTDKDGQQWICDEIDLERGVYVQRVKRMTLDGNVDIWTGTHGNGQPYISVYPGDNALTSIVRSTHYRPAPLNWSDENGYIYCINTAIVILDSRFTTAAAAKEIFASERPEIMYILKEPIETPLPDSVIYAFKDVYTHYPNTTILNDKDAYMEVEYVADTKTFIVNTIYEAMAALTPVISLEIDLPASGWILSKDNTYYYQIVEIEGATEKSQVDLQPSLTQLLSLLNSETTMFTGNENGVITVYAVGSKPTSDMKIQATKKEVV